MPTPIGHLLAGAAIAWAAPRTSANPQVRSCLSWRLTIVCALLASLPDLDLLYQPIHRTATHSVTSAALIFIVATAVTGWVTGRPSVRIGLICAAAWGSHTLLDWLGADLNPPRGIQALWPFSDQWFISDWDLFRRVERRQLLSWPTIRSNLAAAALEVAILGPVALLIWRRRRAPRRPDGPSRPGIHA
jgi:inner membrane protein